MLYNLVTMNINIIEKYIDKYPIVGFSMNPTIATQDLKGSKKDFFENAREISDVIGAEKEFYIQVVGETVFEMKQDAYRIRKEVSGNVFIKVPASPIAYEVIKELKKEGLKVSCTAVMNLNQALLAAAAGADIIAVYVSRLNNQGSNAIGLLTEIQRLYEMNNFSTIVCAASIKEAATIEKLALAGISYVAVSADILDECSRII